MQPFLCSTFLGPSSFSLPFANLVHTVPSSVCHRGFDLTLGFSMKGYNFLHVKMTVFEMKLYAPSKPSGHSHEGKGL